MAEMQTQQHESEQQAAVQWESLQWPDGSWYEGLTRDGMQHRNGIMHHANGDRYEGEFVDGRMDGYGVYVWADGTVYRGQWMRDLAHGCGMRLWRNKDAPPRTPASAQAPPSTGLAPGFQVQEGKFAGDEFVGPVMSCSVEASQQAAIEADVAAHLARTFLTPMGQALRRQRHKTQGSAQPVRRKVAAGGVSQHADDLRSEAGGQSQGSPQPSSTDGLKQQGQRRRQEPALFGWKLSWPWAQADQGTHQKHARAVKQLQGGNSRVAAGAVEGEASGLGHGSSTKKHTQDELLSKKQQLQGNQQVGASVAAQPLTKTRIAAHAPQHKHFFGGWGGFGDTAGSVRHTDASHDGADSEHLVASGSADPSVLSQLHKLPAGHPALDPDVGFRTRRLRQDEQQAVSGLVEHFMALAARQYRNS